MLGSRSQQGDTALSWSSVWCLLARVSFARLPTSHQKATYLYYHGGVQHSPNARRVGDGWTRCDGQGVGHANESEHHDSSRTHWHDRGCQMPRFRPTGHHRKYGQHHQVSSPCGSKATFCLSDLKFHLQALGSRCRQEHDHVNSSQKECESVGNSTA
jgi:hypothetical protein